MSGKDRKLDHVRVNNWEALLPIQSHQLTAGGKDVTGTSAIGSSSRSASATATPPGTFFMFSRMVPDNNSRYAQLLKAKEEPEGSSTAVEVAAGEGQLSLGRQDAAPNPKPLRKALEAAISEATFDFVLIHACHTPTEGGNDVDESVSPARAGSSPAAVFKGDGTKIGSTRVHSKTSSSSSSCSSGVRPGFHAVSLWRTTTTVKELKPECLDWVSYWTLLEDVFRWGRSDRAVLTIFPTVLNPAATRVCRLEVRMLSRHSTASIMAAVLHCSILSGSVSNTLQVGALTSTGDGDCGDVTIIGSTSGVMVAPHSFLLNALSGIMRRLSADTQNKAEVLQLLSDSKQDYEAVLEDKVISEEELMNAFVEVLNTKKEKIRDLTVLAQQQHERIAELEAALADRHNNADVGQRQPSGVGGSVAEREEEELDGGSNLGDKQDDVDSQRSIQGPPHGSGGTTMLEAAARHSQNIVTSTRGHSHLGGRDEALRALESVDEDEDDGLLLGGSTQFQARQESSRLLLGGGGGGAVSSYGNLYGSVTFGQQQPHHSQAVNLPGREEETQHSSVLGQIAGGSGYYLDPREVGRAAGGRGGYGLTDAKGRTSTSNDALGQGRTKRPRDNADELVAMQRKKSAASGADLLNLDI